MLSHPIPYAKKGRGATPLLKQQPAPEVDPQARGKLSSRLQTDEDIAKIIAASPVFLARMARAENTDEIRIIENMHRADGCSSLLPAMFSQPIEEPNPGKAEFSYPGLPFLLDIKFDEQASGIRVNPDRTPIQNLRRGVWARETVKKILSPLDNANIPPASLHTLHKQLIQYSQQRHEREIDIELAATRHCLYELQQKASERRADADVRVSCETCQPLCRGSIC